MYEYLVLSYMPNHITYISKHLYRHISSTYCAPQKKETPLQMETLTLKDEYIRKRSLYKVADGKSNII